MIDIQTWTLLQRDGGVWFDDEKADKTVHLRIVQDLSRTDIIWGKNLADCHRSTLFHLVSPDRHYLVACHAMEEGTDPATLHALIAKELKHACEVKPYQAAPRPARQEQQAKYRHRRAAPRPAAINLDDFAEAASMVLTA